MKKLSLIDIFGTAIIIGIPTLIIVLFLAFSNGNYFVNFITK